LNQRVGTAVMGWT